MTKIEFTEEVKFGDELIASIEVHPLNFLELSSIWTSSNTQPKQFAKLMQRKRIMHQTHFTNKDGDRIHPTEADLGQLALSVVKPIIAALDIGSGKQGRVIMDGDGTISPIIYQLGDPIKTENAKGEVSEIKELEFLASTYGEVEDILVAPTDVAATLSLLQTIASPVDSALPRLPAWAIDRISVADGLTIMQTVLPAF